MLGFLTCSRSENGPLVQIPHKGQQSNVGLKFAAAAFQVLLHLDGRRHHTAAAGR
jgi:hypothetical protein